MTDNGFAPQIDAREFRAMRARTFKAAGRALAALEKITAAHRLELGNGDVPLSAGLRKSADKYFLLLGTLDIADSLLTPEALEAMHADPVSELPNGAGETDPDTVAVRRDHLTLLTKLVWSCGLVPPEAAGGDSPLGQLSALAGWFTPAQAAMVMVPDGEPDPGWPPMSSEDM